jgi:hypothetical protein
MLVIDDHGHLHTLAELQRYLGASLQGAELADYAVENCGFVYVGWHRRRILVQLRPRLVARNTLTALWYWLHDRGGYRPYTVSWSADDGREDLMFGPSLTMRLIEALCEASPAAESDPALRLTRHPLVEPAFRVDMAHVRELVARAPDDPWARQELSAWFGGRWTISELDTSSGQVIVRGMGGGYPLYDCAWTCEPLGRSFDEFPDPAYGSFVTESHYEAFESGRPIHDEVDARINWPRLGFMRTRYARVIMPFLSGPRPLFLSAAKVESSVNL